MDDVMRVTVEQRLAQLPGDRPQLLLGEELALLALAVDQRLHVAFFRVLHHDEEAYAFTVPLFPGACVGHNSIIIFVVDRRFIIRIVVAYVAFALIVKVVFTVINEIAELCCV